MLGLHMVDQKWQNILMLLAWSSLTCVKENRVNERTVPEEGAHWCNIFKVAVTKGGVDEGDRLQLHIDKPEAEIVNFKGALSLIFKIIS